MGADPATVEEAPGRYHRERGSGLVEHVGYHDPDNGFCVLRVKARGQRDLVTVVGRAAAVTAREWTTASGQWANHRTHGHQFKAHSLRSSAPASTEGIEKYLRSGIIRGSGQVYARKLVQAFGDKVLDVIETEPERLREVTGIGQVRAGPITDAWAEQKAVRESMVFLHSHGVATARAVRVSRPADRGRHRSTPLGGAGAGAGRHHRLGHPVPVVRLTEIFRQAARSRIVTSAHGINRGLISELSPPVSITGTAVTVAAPTATDQSCTR